MAPPEENGVPDGKQSQSQDLAKLGDDDRLKMIHEFQLLRVGDSDWEDERIGAVSAASAVIYLDDVDHEMKQDVQNTLLLAQLSANSLAKNSKDYKVWFESFGKSLGLLYWSLPDFTIENRYRSVDPADFGRNVAETVLHDIEKKDSLTEEEYHSLEKLLSQLEFKRNKPAKLVLNRSAIQGKVDKFMLGIVSTFGTNVKMTLLSYYFKDSVAITDCLKHAMKPKTAVPAFIAVQDKLRFYREATKYGVIKDAVEQILKGSISPGETTIAGIYD